MGQKTEGGIEGKIEMLITRSFFTQLRSSFLLTSLFCEYKIIMKKNIGVTCDEKNIFFLGVIFFQGGGAGRGLRKKYSYIKTPKNLPKTIKLIVSWIYICFD